MKLFITLITLLLSLNVISQNCDTSYYYNTEKVRSIKCKEDGNKKITTFYTIDGVNIFNNNEFSYEFFDEEHKMQRIIKSLNAKVFEDFWYSENDTLFNEFNYSDQFRPQITKLFQYLSRNLIFPKEAKQSNLNKRRVRISFIVNENGEITQIKPITNLGQGLETEAIRVIKSYQNWGVIKYNNKPVSLYLRLPVSFVLK